MAFGFLGIFLGPVLLGIGFTLMNEWATAGRQPIEAAVSPRPPARTQAVEPDTADVP